MKLQVLQETFSKALNIGVRFVNNRAQLPILTNIFIEGKKNKLLVQATNLENSISIYIGAKTEEEGSLAVPAKTLSDLIANLEKGSLLLETENEHLKINSNNFSGSLLGINPTDFPKLPREINKHFLKMPRNLLIEALLKVLFSSSTDEARPVLTGVLFIFKENELILVATDGFRLSQKKIALKEKIKAEVKNLILPRSSLSEFVHLESKEEENSKEDLLVEVNPQENQILFGFNDVVFSSRVISGEFPSFEKIIPKSSRVKISLDKNDLLRAVKLSSVFARDNSNILTISIKKGVLEFSAESSKNGNQKTKLEAKVNGEDMDITFNYRFIEEFLNVVDTNTISLELTDINSPGVFKDDNDPDYLHLIMPIKIQG